MIKNANFNDYQYLLTADLPLLDVRAPIEFQQGAFPQSLNLPLLNDDERQAVGRCFKQTGQSAAIELGHRLINGKIKRQRIDAWISFIQQNPLGYLYCFRGGLRSQLTQNALREAGVHYPIIEGGYKAMRRYLLNQLANLSLTKNFIVIGGYTGSGKTRVIKTLTHSINLESIAMHKGSAFGQQLETQPSQINFENLLSITLLKHVQAICIEHPEPLINGSYILPRALFIEDESRLIGRCSLPTYLRRAMQNAAFVLVEEPLQNRLELIIEEYITANLKTYEKYHKKDAISHLKQHVIDRLAKLRKRLGTERCMQLQKIATTAFTKQQKNNDIGAHCEWIESLLTEYYDPMYKYQLKKKNRKPLIAGSRKLILEWAQYYETDVNKKSRKCIQQLQNVV